MTRMWMLDPRLLCQNHLLGEHNELHKLVGGIQNHPHGRAIAEGQAAKGNIDTAHITERHKELVVELQRRGHSHDSPLNYQDDLDLGEIDVRRNAEDLADRCKECQMRMLQRPDITPGEGEVVPA